MGKIMINGQTYRRRLKSNGEMEPWGLSNQRGESRTLGPKTQRWINRWKVNQKSNRVIVRFPRLNPFDANNPTWENIPRFDPEKNDDTEWLIKFFIADKSINLIYAPAGYFKSTLMLFAAKRIASGGYFLGLKTLQRRVLYLDYENPAHVIKARSLDFQLNLPENDYLIIWDRFGPNPTPRPRDPILRKFVKACVTRDGIGPLIIFDSWSSLMKPGEGGESTGQTAPIYKRLRKLADLGATIVVIDHPRKDGDSIYGSVDKIAKSDTIHVLEVRKNPHDPENRIVSLISTLKRYTPEGYGGFSFKVVSEKDDSGWHVKGFESIADPKIEEHRLKLEKLREIIQENPEATQKGITKLAAEKNLSRDETISLLQEGIGTYWSKRKGKHGRHRYEPIIFRVN